MMKKIISVITPFLIGLVIGYWCSTCIRSAQARSQGIPAKAQSPDAIRFRHVYYTQDSDWEELIFRECEDFGPV